MNARGLCVVGAGVWSPAGRTAAEAARILRTGIPAVRPAPFSDGTGAPITMGVAPGLGSLEGLDRLAALSERAAKTCLLEVTEREPTLASRVGLAVVYSPIEVVTLGDANRMSASLARGLRLDKAAPVRGVADGASSAADILEEACGWVARGEVALCLVGGCHSDHTQDRIRALHEAGRLYTNENITGSFPGEHAAFVAITNLGRARRTAPLATLVAAGAEDGPLFGPDALSVTPEILRSILPEGLAVRAGWVFGDLAFDPTSIREHGALLVRAGDYLTAPHHLDYPAQLIGALGAAALPLGLAMVATSWQLGRVPSPAAIVLSQNDAGRRGVVVLRQPEERRAE